jgi:hypothetical protein
VIVSRRGFLASAAALAASRLALADEAGSDLLARIARARAPMTTLRGPFTQSRTIGLLAAEVRSHGVLTLVRPDRLRWELAAPDDVTFWVGPEGLAYRSPHGQGRMAEAGARIAAQLADLRTLLGGDVAQLGDRWRLRVVHDGRDGAELEATPVQGALGAPAGVTTLRLSLAPDLVRPTHVLLVQGSHDRTVLEFGDLAVNVPVDAATMRPPPS